MKDGESWRDNGNANSPIHQLHDSGMWTLCFSSRFFVVQLLRLFKKMELVLCHCLLRSCGWRVLCKLEMTLYSSQSNQLPCRYDIETKIMIDSIQTVQLLGQIGTQMPSHGSAKGSLRQCRSHRGPPLVVDVLILFRESTGRRRYSARLQEVVARGS